MLTIAGKSPRLFIELKNITKQVVVAPRLIYPEHGPYATEIRDTYGASHDSAPAIVLHRVSSQLENLRFGAIVGM